MHTCYHYTLFWHTGQWVDVSQYYPLFPHQVGNILEYWIRDNFHPTSISLARPIINVNPSSSGSKNLMLKKNQ